MPSEINALLIYQSVHVLQFYLLENMDESDYNILNCLKSEYPDLNQLQIIDDALSTTIDVCIGSKPEYYCKWSQHMISLPIYNKCINFIYHYDCR